ncbi:MAG: nitrogenase cofactor biosynthesis protein NifB [Rhodospirillales bacterium]|nr:nitrogenase cofactor biosynthesis protein NifB [Rhodospirillales bacterium]
MTDNVVSLETVGHAMAGRSPTGGCSSDGCSPPSNVAALPEHVREKIKEHPCYSEEAHHYFARIHLAVAPACNIQCNYCNRKYDCSNESRPGVVSERLTPEQAVHKVQAVAAEMPHLSVVGIAGPGDALADHERTFATFRMLRETMPDLTLCLSTNGLALPDHVETIRELGINHVTVTVSAIDPEIAAKIYAWIFYDHQRLTGVDAARIIIARQLEGIEMLTKAGILVKINSVLIPGINDHHLETVNAEMKKRGAFLHNIMPLISDPAHGTHFGLTGQRGPTPVELKELQDQLGDGARLMKHCRQCRADAVGLLGEDKGQDFGMDSLPEDPQIDPEKREAYRAIVEKEREDRRRIAAEARATLRRFAPEEAMLVAVSSKGGGRVNQHFGHAKEFQIFEVSQSGSRFVGHRRVERYCGGGDGEDDVLEATIAALEGVSVVLTAKIGRCPRQRLDKAGIEVTDDYGLEYIETAIARYLADRAAEDNVVCSA